MNARVFWIAAALAGLSGTAQAGDTQKFSLRFWGVEVREQNRCGQWAELDATILDQLEQLGKSVLTRPADTAFRSGCIGKDCASQWPLPAPSPTVAGQDPARNSERDPDRMLGGHVEAVTKEIWRGRLWYYVSDVKNLAVRDVFARRELLASELAYAAAALVLAPDVTQNAASSPTYCEAEKRRSQSSSLNKRTSVHIGVYRRPGMEPFAQALRKALEGLTRQFGASAHVEEYLKPRDKYADKDEACRPEKKNGAPQASRKQSDCAPVRPESGLVEAELIQGTDLGGGGNHSAALKEIRLRWRVADNRAEPRERTLAVPAGVTPESLVRMVMAAIRPKLAGVVDGTEFSLERGSRPTPDPQGLCAAFSAPSCGGGSNVADECRSGPEPSGCRTVYCGAHPADKRCQKVDPCALGSARPECQAIYCASHPTESRCLCGAPGQPPCQPAIDHGIRARKAFTFVFAGIAAVSAGLFIWRAAENNNPASGDCALPDDMTVTIKNSCVQRNWPSMLGTGLPALILPGLAAAIWPYPKKASSSAKQQDGQAARQ